MKVRVIRELVEGRYQVAFQVGEFSADEVKKMSQFGTPTIVLQKMQNAGLIKFAVPITQIPQVIAAFPNEEAAKRYEAEVVQQLKDKIEGVRVREDKFTSTEEIAF